MRRWLWQFALLGALACGCLQAAVPERPRFRLVGPAQGLPSTEIKALAHDAAGYLWIATADGLARYDGVGMRVWRHDPDQPGSLPGNNVQALVVDARDRVWAATEGGGVSVLDATRQQFVHFRKDRHPELGSDDVWAMARQGDAIWLGTYDGGLTRIDADGSMRRFTAAVHGLPSDIVLSLAVDAGNRLWVGTPKGLAREHAGGFEAVTLPGADEAPTVFSLSREADGLWVGTSHGVWVQGRDGWQQPDWSPTAAATTGSPASAASGGSAPGNLRCRCRLAAPRSRARSWRCSAKARRRSGCRSRVAAWVTCARTGGISRSCRVPRTGCAASSTGRSGPRAMAAPGWAPSMAWSSYCARMARYARSTTTPRSGCAGSSRLR